MGFFQKEPLCWHLRRRHIQSNVEPTERLPTYTDPAHCLKTLTILLLARQHSQVTKYSLILDIMMRQKCCHLLVLWAALQCMSFYIFMILFKKPYYAFWSFPFPVVCRFFFVHVNGLQRLNSLPLDQGSQTQGPGAKSGPRLHFMWPRKSLQRI